MTTVAHVNSTNSGSGDQTTCTMPSTTATHVVVVRVAYYDGASASCTVAAGSGKNFTSVSKRSFTGNSVPVGGTNVTTVQEIFIRVLDGTESSTITATPSGGSDYTNVSAEAYSGCDQT